MNTLHGLFILVLILTTLSIIDPVQNYLILNNKRVVQETTYWQDAALTCPTWPAAKVNR